MYKSFLGKIEECWNCGRRLSIRQRYCVCGKKNLDFKPRNWMGAPVAEIEENPENNNEEDMLGRAQEPLKTDRQQ
jgi:hypothetical protein